MESMRHDIEFRQSNRSADFIQGIEEDESSDRFINRGRMLHTLFSAIETADDIEPAIERLVFEGVIRDQDKEEMTREVVCCLEWSHFLCFLITFLRLVFLPWLWLHLAELLMM
jgi:3-dehydroquinate dehydratase